MLIKQHMLAMCSIYWQGNQDDGEKVRRNDVRSTRCQDMLDIANLLPRYIGPLRNEWMDVVLEMLQCLHKLDDPHA
jgi:hypothetical protein